MVPEDMPPLPQPSDEDEDYSFGDEGGGAAAAAAPAPAPDLQPDFFSYRNEEEGVAEPAGLSTEDRSRPTVLLRPPRQLPPEPPLGHQAMVDIDAELLAAVTEGDALRRDQVRTPLRNELGHPTRTPSC